MREVLLGATRFDQIVRNTGAPRNILAARLSRLVDAGLLCRRQYSDRPPRADYLPTEAGYGIEPVLQTLMAWGDQHLGAPDNPPTVFEHSCGQPLQAEVVCACCGGKADRDSLTILRLGGQDRPISP